MRPHLGSVLRTLGHAPYGVSVPAKPVLVGTNNLDGTFLLTVSNIQAAAGVQPAGTVHSFYQSDGDSAETTGPTRLDNGTITIPATGILDQDVWYSLWVYQSVNSLPSSPSNMIRLETVIEGSQEVASRGVEYAIVAATRGRRSQWYQQRTESGYPGTALNVAYAQVGSDEYAYTSQQKVSIQPNRWVHRGEIPVLIQTGSPFSLVARAYGEVNVGSREGTVAARYNVRMGDHLIDPEGNEFRVVTSERPMSVVVGYRRLTLELLP